MDIGETLNISPAQYFAMCESKIACRWVETGVLLVTDAPQPWKQPELKRPAVEDQVNANQLPAELTGEGVEQFHTGGGWWDVYVNGFKVTIEKVRKAEAQQIAEEYK
ncbi:MAG: hypothetical protein ACREO9_02260 [Lysobacterales bacterium]